MKKLTLALAAATIAFSATAAEQIVPKKLYTGAYSNNFFAVDKTGNKHHVVVYKLGENQWEYLILNNDKELSVLKTISVTLEYRIEYFECMYDGYDVVLSQHVFNDDDKWEYVIEESYPEEVTDEWGQTYTRYRYKYFVYNEDGESLGELETDEMHLYVNGEVQYFYDVDDKENGGHYIISFQGNGTDGVKQLSPKVVRSAVVYPNPVRENAKLTIELASALSDRGNVSLIDASGRAVYRHRVECGEQTLTVPSIKLRPGTYIYVVECNGKIVASDKIIVD